jgi:hypothetical protein
MIKFGSLNLRFKLRFLKYFEIAMILTIFSFNFQSEDDMIHGSITTIHVLDDHFLIFKNVIIHDQFC